MISKSFRGEEITMSVLSCSERGWKKDVSISKVVIAGSAESAAEWFCEFVAPGARSGWLRYMWQDSDYP